ncbi:unnamed protein product, partial [Amoebophrya sp. A25]
RTSWDNRKKVYFISLINGQPWFDNADCGVAFQVEKKRHPVDRRKLDITIDVDLKLA